MKVVFNDGKEGILPDEQTTNLYLRDRFTKAAWQEVESEMVRLRITQFEDPYVGAYLTDLIHIDYVRNQIAAH